jgi:hypothetical protein
MGTKNDLIRLRRALDAIEDQEDPTDDELNRVAYELFRETDNCGRLFASDLRTAVMVLRAIYNKGWGRGKYEGGST